MTEGKDTWDRSNLCQASPSLGIRPFLTWSRPHVSMGDAVPCTSLTSCLYPIFDQKYPSSRFKPETCSILQGWSRIFPGKRSFPQDTTYNVISPPYSLHPRETEKHYLVILSDMGSPRSRPRDKDSSANSLFWHKRE